MKGVNKNMLITREMEFTEQLSNSDGNKIADIATYSYTAIYDTNNISDKEAKKYLQNYSLDESDQNDNIVILPTKDWKKLHDMITNNYKMEAK